VRSWPSFSGVCRIYLPQGTSSSKSTTRFAALSQDAAASADADAAAAAAAEADAADFADALVDGGRGAAPLRDVADADADDRDGLSDGDADGEDAAANSDLAADLLHRGAAAETIAAALAAGGAGGAAAALLELDDSLAASAGAIKPALTGSLKREKEAAAKPVIPRGLGSPSFSDIDLPKPAVEDLWAECMQQWSALGAVPEAWAVVAGEGGDATLSGATWDPMTACRCLSICPYNSIDALAVEETCGGVFDARSPPLAAGELLAAAAAAAPPRSGDSAAARYKDTVLASSRS
jgi:hypothetical protein